MSPQQADKFFLQVAMEIREKPNFFVNLSVPKNFQWQNFRGKYPRNPYTFRIQNIHMNGGGRNFFDRILPARIPQKLHSHFLDTTEKIELAKIIHDKKLKSLRPISEAIEVFVFSRVLSPQGHIKH